MKRLIAAGCSLTYGHGLPDCVDRLNQKAPGILPSKLSWPKLVADQLNRYCINLSRPGASNKEIWHTLLKSNFEPDDIVIVNWSFLYRFCSLISTREVKQILLKTPEKESKFYYKSIFTSYDSVLDFYLRVRDADAYVRSQGVEKIIHTTIEDLDNLTAWHRIKKDYSLPEIKSSFTQSPEFVKINSILDKNSIWIDMALDDVHPGVRSHQRFADQLLSIL